MMKMPNADHPFRVYAPVIMGVPCEDACRSMMMLPDGEIRVYGTDVRPETRSAEEVRPVYLSSTDYGVSWTTHSLTDPFPGATVRSPVSGTWITVFSRPASPSGNDPDGVFLARGTSPDGPFEVHRVDNLFVHIQRQPLLLSTRNRWILPFEKRMADSHCVWGVYLSDDDGETWRRIDIPSPELPGVLPGHKGLRWIHCGIEPVVAQYPDGHLHALLRCANDVHYECFSYDDGETWTAPKPSAFHAVATMPGLYRISGDRVIAVWNNTMPLREEDHRTQYGSGESLVKGIWEDVFTNRDALHAAISSDNGKTWRGFREILLNPARNDGDFRSVFFPYDGLDKSVHQNQLLELPDGTLLVAAGQNPVSRRLVRFHPDWLLEDSREEDFSHGLGCVSVHQFLKSPVGSYRGVTGHCSYNRRMGAALVPHPDGPEREALQIARHPDSRVLSEIEGVVWNFPASHSGRVAIRYYQNRGMGGTDFMLLHHWVNPSDPDAADYASYRIRLDSLGQIECHGIPEPFHAWHTLELVWDDEQKKCTVYTDGTPIAECSQSVTCEYGLSYLLIQSAARSADNAGIFVDFLKKSPVEPVMTNSTAGSVEK